jgi:hypothetical protein
VISTYDQQTGDGHWLRQSLEILKGEMGMICQNCLEDADCCICKIIAKASVAVEQLKSEWLATIGSPMPDRVAVMGIEKIKLALGMAKNGAVFGECSEGLDDPF